MRPVPHLIDRRNRAGEYAMSFMVPLFLLRTIDPLFALGCSIVLAALYMKCTFGRADGHLVHRIYRLGVPLGGLLDPRVERYVP